jgi:MFS family permease
MQQTAMSWFVYQITNSKLLLGTVAAVGSAPMMLFSIWGGSLADLYPKRSILVATQTAQMICAFLLAVGAWAGFATPLLIIAIAALNGVAMGFDMPARQVFTVEMTSREDLLNAISLNSSIVNGARVVGSIICWFADRFSRCRDLLFPKRCDVRRGDRRFVNDAVAAI